MSSPSRDCHLGVNQEGGMFLGGRRRYGYSALLLLLVRQRRGEKQTAQLAESREDPRSVDISLSLFLFFLQLQAENVGLLGNE